MNPIIKALALVISSLGLITVSQAAVPSADLKVKGQLVVPTCLVNAAHDGVYDLGKISATTVKPNANTALPKQSQTWTITCDAETYLNLAHSDNRADSVSTVSNEGGANFGLGAVNNGGKIGFYKVLFENGSIDGRPAYFFVSQGPTITSNNHVKSLHLYTGWRLGWADPSALAQKSGKVFVADVAIFPTLASSQNMKGPITDDTHIDGSLTMTFAYGI